MYCLNLQIKKLLEGCLTGKLANKHFGEDGNYREVLIRGLMQNETKK